MSEELDSITKELRKMLTEIDTMVRSVQAYGQMVADRIGEINNLIQIYQQKLNKVDNNIEADKNGKCGK